MPPYLGYTYKGSSRRTGSPTGAGASPVYQTPAWLRALMQRTEQQTRTAGGGAAGPGAQPSRLGVNHSLFSNPVKQTGRAPGVQRTQYGGQTATSGPAQVEVPTTPLELPRTQDQGTAGRFGPGRRSDTGAAATEPFGTFGGNSYLQGDQASVVPQTNWLDEVQRERLAGSRKFWNDIAKFISGGAGGLAGAVYGGGAGLRAGHPFGQVLEDTLQGFVEGGRGAREVAQQNIEETGAAFPAFAGGGGEAGVPFDADRARAAQRAGGRFRGRNEAGQPTTLEENYGWALLRAAQEKSEADLASYYQPSQDDLGYQGFGDFGGGGGGGGGGGFGGFGGFDPADPAYWLGQLRWLIS